MARIFCGMRPLVQWTVVAAGLALGSPAMVSEADAAKNWGQWRGPMRTGVSKTAEPPTEWSESKNITWKIEIPGRGSSSPVVWGDRIFLLTAIPAGLPATDSHKPLGAVTPRRPHRYKVLAINRADGKIVWEQTAREEAPHEAAHQDNRTWASSSPA